MTVEEFKQLFPKWEYLTFDYGYWSAIHQNYDAEYAGEEDGWVDNGLRCSGRTLEELAEECKEKESQL